MTKRKVRIALAITPDGAYNATGWGFEDGDPLEEDVMGVAIDPLGDGEARYWIETEVEVPDTSVVRAEAIPAH